MLLKVVIVKIIISLFIIKHLKNLKYKITKHKSKIMNLSFMF